MNWIQRRLRKRFLAKEKRRLHAERLKLYERLKEKTRQIQAITVQEAELYERQPDN